MSHARIRVEGDRAQQGLLGPVLEWGTERIAAVMGGCATFSARSQVVGEASGIAADGSREAGPRAAWPVHRRVLPPSSSAEIVGWLDAGAAVVRFDAGDAQLAELVGALNLTMPLVIRLRAQGRVGGLIWLCLDARAGIDERESARELRGLHPLLELTHRTGIVEARGHASGELAEMGLTARELAVARLVLGGASNPEIAKRLSISESTVKKHVSRVLTKCGVRSRTQLIALLGAATDDP